MKHVADVIIDIPDDMPLISCVPGRLSQVFINLLLNASDAIDECGSTVGRGTITISGRRDGDVVVMSIVDTGMGMTDAVKERLFEPIFTRKNPGVGTGQGLAICQSIVTEHHGVISVTSKVGSGTTFTIRLPVPRALQREATRGFVRSSKLSTSALNDKLPQ